MKLIILFIQSYTKEKKGMPLFINFTDPFYVLIALILFVLLVFLSRNTKSNTAPAIELLIYLFILTIHTVELIVSSNDSNVVITLTKCITIDEVFIFISFLNLLWADRLQIEKEKKNKGKGKKGKVEKSFEDGLDTMFKKV